MYVTFQIAYHHFWQRWKTVRYAVKCPNEKIALEVASDINSIDGISYLRLNRCGKINKNCRVISSEDYLNNNTNGWW